MQPIRTLTFDLDDTLWDNRPVLKAAEQVLYDWLTEHYPRICERYTSDELRSQRMELARSNPDLRHHMTALRKTSLQIAAESAGYDESLVEPAFAVFLEARHRITLYEDVIPALQALRNAGYCIGSLTNGNANVERLEIGHLFDFSLTAESVGKAKPHPRMFEEACRLGQSQPWELVHIGDEPATDLAAAQTAGIRVIWMNRTHRPADPSVSAHAEVHNMGELLTLFGLD